MLFSGDVVAVTALLSFIAGGALGMCIACWILYKASKETIKKIDDISDEE